LRHDQYQPYWRNNQPAGCTDLQPSETNHPQAYLWSGLSGTERLRAYYSDHVSIEPNPYLQTEKIRTEEFIWEQDVGGDFRISASGFGSQFTDLITQEVDPKTAFIVYENSQSAHNRGLELELGGKIPSGLEGRLSYTLQKTVDPSTRLSLSDSPTQLAKANIIFPLAHRSLTIGFELQ